MTLKKVLFHPVLFRQIYNVMIMIDFTRVFCRKRFVKISKRHQVYWLINWIDIFFSPNIFRKITKKLWFGKSIDLLKDVVRSRSESSRVARWGVAPISNVRMCSKDPITVHTGPDCIWICYWLRVSLTLIPPFIDFFFESLSSYYNLRGSLFQHYFPVIFRLTGSSYNRS